MSMKFVWAVCVAVACVCADARGQDVVIGVGGNAYVTRRGEGDGGAKVTDKGIEQWRDGKETVSVYFHVAEPQELDVAVNARGDSRLQVSCGAQSHRVNVKAEAFSPVPVGTFKVAVPGYVRVDMRGERKRGDTFGSVSELVLKAPKGKVTHVHDFSNYWGRRGPSVHMRYALPKTAVEWFYNEVTVPAEGETLGSYYMANGFGEGYFGIQYNSPTERRVLFSVWSPFQTDNPKSIPADQQVRLLQKGKGVHTGEFGNEGSGGQSYLRYNWKAGTTYRFLARVRPDGQGNTVYTGYFYAADEKRWRLIASFLRPKTDTWYTSAHSFLENFNPAQGYLSRSVEFGNQWARDAEGTWHELTEGTFTYDATARAGVRLDYQGGLVGESRFYLKNGGFFSDSTAYQSVFRRKPSGMPPDVDVGQLK